MTRAPTRRPGPVVLWAVIVQSRRTRWIHYGTIARTRSKAIERYERILNKVARAKAWALSRARGCTCEKIIVEVWRGH